MGFAQNTEIFNAWCLVWRHQSNAKLKMSKAFAAKVMACLAVIFRNCPQTSKKQNKEIPQNSLSMCYLVRGTCAFVCVVLVC